MLQVQDQLKTSLLSFCSTVTSASSCTSSYHRLPVWPSSSLWSSFSSSSSTTNAGTTSVSSPTRYSKQWETERPLPAGGSARAVHPRTSCSCWASCSPPPRCCSPAWTKPRCRTGCLGFFVLWVPPDLSLTRRPRTENTQLCPRNSTRLEKSSIRGLEFLPESLTQSGRHAEQFLAQGDAKRIKVCCDVWTGLLEIFNNHNQLWKFLLNICLSIHPSRHTLNWSPVCRTQRHTTIHLTFTP